MLDKDTKRLGKIIVKYTIYVILAIALVYIVFMLAGCKVRLISR